MDDLCATAVPVEALSQAFRRGQKRVTKVLRRVSTEISALENSESHEKDAKGTICALIEELEAVKRECEAQNGREKQQIARAQVRAALAAEGPKSVTDWAWYTRLLDTAVAEFLLKSGDQDAAKTLEREAKLDGFLDHEVYRDLEEVELSLRAGDCARALQWCQENGSRLRRLNSPLVFQLTLQQFVELVREKRHAEALEFARENLSAYASEAAYSHDYQVAMATIALGDPATSGIPEYAALFGSGRWDELARLFQREVRRAYGMSAKGVLDVAVQAGLCALKTRACVTSAGGEAMGVEEEKRGGPVALARQCPVCSPAGRRLAETLPFPHRPQSVLLCPFTYERIHEDNLPYMLPSGRMISQHALQRLLAGGEPGLGELEVSTQDVLEARQVYII